MAEIVAFKGKKLQIRVSLKSYLQLNDGGSSENLSDITKLVNESFPNYSAAAVHNCLVSAYPDLQAQQSDNKEEVYYLGIRLINSQPVEDKVVNWLRQRFKEDKFGRVSCRTLVDIATKEVSYVKTNVIGSYVRKAFPNVFIRRSDRLRWYCGIALPEKEKEVSVEEKKRKLWLDSACKWLRQNMKESGSSKEKCGLVYAALVQFVGKVAIDNCMTAVKCVFPNITRKTFNRQAFYFGVEFSQASLREKIKYSPPKSKRGVVLPQPILSDEEKEFVAWLRGVLDINEKHREKLQDLSNMMSIKVGVHIADKCCLAYTRKAFPNVSYRKRDGVGHVTGIEIKSIYKPRDHWLDKSANWLKSILVRRQPEHCEKFASILEYMKHKLQYPSYAKLCEVFHVAFPQTTIKKTLDGKIVQSIGFIENYRSIAAPEFCDDDFVGDFSDVDFAKVQLDENICDTSKCNSDQEKQSENLDQAIPNQMEPAVEGDIKKLQQKIDELSSHMSNMNTEMKRLRDELGQSMRQKDTLIVQLQQALVLLTQQHFQRILKPTEGALSNQQLCQQNENNQESLQQNGNFVSLTSLVHNTMNKNTNT